MNTKNLSIRMGFRFRALVALLATATAVVGQAEWAQHRPLQPNRILPFATDSNGARLPQIEYGQGHVTDALFLNSSGTLLVQGLSKLVQYPLDGSRPLRTFESQEIPISQVALSDDETILLTGHNNGFVQFWDLQTGLRLAGHLAHANAITALALAADGRTYATSDVTGLVRIWDFGEPSPQANLEGHERNVFRLGFSPTTDFLLSVGSDRVARVWNTQTHKNTRSFGILRDRLLTASFSEDATHVITAYQRNPVYRVYDRDSGDLVREIESPSNALSVNFSNDLKHAISVNISASAILVQPLSPPHAGTRLSFAGSGRFGISNDGDHIYRTLGSGGDQPWLEVVEFETGDRQALLPAHLERVIGLGFAPDGQRLVSSDLAGALRVTDRTTGEILATASGRYSEFSFSSTQDAVFASRWNDGNWGFDLASGDFAFQDRTSIVSSLGPHRYLLVNATEEGRVFVTDRTANATYPELEGDRYSRSTAIPRGYIFSPDQKFIGRQSRNEDFHVWEIDTGRLRYTISPGHDVATALMFPDNRHLATRHEDGRIGLWDLQGQESTRWFFDAAESASALALSADGSHLAAGTDAGRVVLINLAGTSEPLPLAGHPVAVTAAAFTPDGQFLATGDADGIIKLWNLGPDLQPIPLEIAAGESLRLGIQSPFGLARPLQWEKDGLLIAAHERDLTTGLALQLDATTLEDVGRYVGVYDPDNASLRTMPLALTIRRPLESITDYTSWAIQFPWGSDGDHPTADPDADGNNNWSEFLANTHPLQPESKSDLLGVERLGNEIILSIRLAPYATEIPLAIESTQTLGDWQPVTLEFTKGQSPDGSEIQTARLENTVTHQFYRWTSPAP